MQRNRKGDLRAHGRMLLLGLVVLGLMGAAPVAGDALPPSAASPDRQFGVEVLSTRADAVTGGDVLVEVDVPRTVPPHQVRVSVDGRDVTDAFHQGAQPRTMVGLVDGLVVGANTLQVSANGRGEGRPSTSIELVNHPITGPVFSGPHQEPFICQTRQAGLGDPADPGCGARTRIDYFYRTIAGEFKPFDTQAPKPHDLAQTTTTDGVTTDYIVRKEKGVINRAIYEIAFLHTPNSPLPDPWRKTNTWTGTLVYNFGGGCGAGYRQGEVTAGVQEDDALSAGFAVASSTLNVFHYNCNDVLSAETAMMVKEHFIERFGPDRWTIGTGDSGGSMQQHLIAQNYPGILDGILPRISFSDITSLIAPASDCDLILAAVDDGQIDWTTDKLQAATGFATVEDLETCSSWEKFTYSTKWIDATACLDVPEELIYDAVSNPDGARCAVHDNLANVYGIDGASGIAPRPLDNVGVQYGLDALNEGKINFEEFADLNERIGGHDIDGKRTPRRTEANPGTLTKAYGSGRVNVGSGGLGDIPIIDIRIYLDDVPSPFIGGPGPDIHDKVRSFATRQRLIKENGNADNQVIFTFDSERLSAQDIGAGDTPLRLMDRWLAAISADTRPGSASERVVRNKPAEATDTCWTTSGAPIVEPATFSGRGKCNELYPAHEDPRMAAGAPLAGDVLKCTLKPISTDGYEIRLTAQQLNRLRQTFPTGVCDWSQPSVGWAQLAGTWLDYSSPFEP